MASIGFTLPVFCPSPNDIYVRAGTIYHYRLSTAKAEHATDGSPCVTGGCDGNGPGAIANNAPSCTLSSNNRAKKRFVLKGETPKTALKKHSFLPLHPSPSHLSGAHRLRPLTHQLPLPTTVAVHRDHTPGMFFLRCVGAVSPRLRGADIGCFCVCFVLYAGRPSVRLHFHRLHPTRPSLFLSIAPSALL